MAKIFIPPKKPVTLVKAGQIINEPGLGYGGGPVKKKDPDFIHNVWHTAMSNYNPVVLSAHVNANLLRDIKEQTIPALVGLGSLGKSAVHDANAFISPARLSSSGKVHDRPKSQLGEIGKGVAKQYETYYSGHEVDPKTGKVKGGGFGGLAHNLYKHPLQPLIDALTLVTAGGAATAKLGQIGLLGERGAALGRAGTRSFRVPDATKESGFREVKIPTSRNPATRAMEDFRHWTLTRGISRLEDHLMGGRQSYLNETRRGIRYEQKFDKRTHQTNVNRMLHPFEKAWRGLTATEEVAVSLRAQGLHPQEFRPFVETQLDGARAALNKATDPKVKRYYKQEIKAHQRMLKWTKGVTPELYDSVLTNPKLSAAHKAASELMDEAANVGVNFNLLHPEDVMNRPLLGVRIMRGARYNTYEQIAQASLEQSASRARMHATLDKMSADLGLPPEVAQEFKNVMDDVSRVEASKAAGSDQEAAQLAPAVYDELTAQYVKEQFVPREMYEGMPERLTQAARSADVTREGIIDHIFEDVQRIVAEQKKESAPHNQIIPPDMLTREGVAAKVDELTNMALEGEFARAWYTQSGKDILEAVKGDKADARKVAALVAVTSPQQAVFMNVQSAIQLWNRYKELGPKKFQKALDDLDGTDIKPSQSPVGVKGLVSKEQYQAALDIMNGVDPATHLGPKTHSFYRNFLQEFDPKGFKKEYPGETPERGPVTFDTWMRRALGYPKRFIRNETKTPRQAKQYKIWQGLTDAQKADVEAGKSVEFPKYEEPISPKQYAFGENVTSAIADSLGWKPHEAQAAIWTAIKSRVEGTSGMGGQFHIGDALRRLDAEGTQILFQKARDTGISKDWNPYTGGEVFSEANPVTNTAAINAYNKLTPEQKSQFAATIQEEMSGKFEEILGLRSLGDRQGTGVWRGKIEPGYAAHVELPEGVLSAEMAAKMDALSAAQGWAQHAGSVSWGHKVPKNTPVDGEHIFEGRHWTPKQGTNLEALDDILNPPGQEGTIGLVHAREGGFNVVNFGNRADFSKVLDENGVAAGRENNRWQGSYTIDKNSPDAGWSGEKSYQDVIAAQPEAEALMKAIQESQGKVNEALGIEPAQWIKTSDVPEGGIPGRVLHATNAAGKEAIQSERRVRVGNRTEPAAAHFSEQPWQLGGSETLSLPAEAVEGVNRSPFGTYASPEDVKFQKQQVGLEGGEARGIYIPKKGKQSAKMVFGRSANETTVMHEFGHHIASLLKGTPYESTFASRFGAKWNPETKEYMWPVEAEEMFANSYLTYLRDSKGPLGDSLRKLDNRMDFPEIHPLVREAFQRLHNPPKLKSGELTGGPALDEVRTIEGLIAHPHIGKPLKEGTTQVQRMSGASPPLKPGLSRLNKGLRLQTSQWLPGPSAFKTSFVHTVSFAAAKLRGEYAFSVARPLDDLSELAPGWYYVREGTNKPLRAETEARGLDEAYHSYLERDGADLEKHIDKEYASKDEATAQEWLDRGDEVRQISPGEYKDIFGEFKQASKFVQKWIDSPTNFWRTLTLTYRPAWVVNNIVGQSLLYAVNHLGHARGSYIKAALEEARGQSTIPDELRYSGFVHSETPNIGGAVGGIKRFEHIWRDRIQRFNASLSDNVPRNATYKAILNKMEKTHDNVAELRKYIEEHKGNTKDLPENLRQMHDEVVQEVLDELIDFGNLTDFERRYIRRAVPFYSWIKGIMKATAHLGFHHPGRALILLLLGREGQRANARDFGVGGKTVAGFLPFGKAVNGVFGGIGTTGLNPWATPGQAAGSALGLSTASLDPADNPLLQANPILQAVVTALGRHDLYSGKATKGSIGSVFFKELGLSPPQTQLILDLINPKDGPRKLTPQHRIDLLARYFGLPLTHKRVSTAKSLATKPPGR